MTKSDRLNAWVRQCADAPERGIDRAEVRRALDILIAPDQTFAVQGLPSAHWRICSGADLDAATDAAYELSDGAGVYFTLNLCRADLVATPKNADIVGRRWFLIDVDRRSPGETNASEAEKLLVTEVAYRASDYLWEAGWPNPVMTDSGNGNHLYYRIDLPNDPLSRSILKGVLAELKSRFDTDRVEIDGKVIDARRISKLPGTYARKGPHSDERPHRLARLVYVPDRIEVVTVEQLNGVGRALPPTLYGAPAPSPHVNGIARLIHGTNGSDLTHYVQSAIDRECARIELTPPGGRNDALNIAAFNLGLMAMWPEMLAQDARHALLVAALRAGLGDLESRKTIESGWTSGAAKPRPRPVPASHGPTIATPNGTTGPLPSDLVIGLDEVEPKTVEWISQDRIAIGFISIFAGRTGVGKSFVLCDYAARLSRGLPLPDEPNRFPPVRTLMISEDPIEYMLAPRLIELGADRSMIKFMKWKAMATFSMGDTKMLDQLYEAAKHPLLISIDPPANFLNGKDEHRNAEVREILMPLVEWIDTHRVACVFITHINKQIGKGIEALDRIMGSVAWASTSRIAMGFTKDPQNPGQCIFGGLKNNLGMTARSLSYEIVKTDICAKIEWKGEAGITADEAMKTTGPLRRVVASEWMVEQFRSKRDWPSEELIKNAHSHGISRSACFEAKKLLKMPKARKVTEENGDTSWTWWVPPNWDAFDLYPADSK